MATWRDAELTRGSAKGTVRHEWALLAHVFKVARKEWGMEAWASRVDTIHLSSPGQARARRLVGDGVHVRLLAAAFAYGGEIGPIIPWA